MMYDAHASVCEERYHLLTTGHFSKLQLGGGNAAAAAATAAYDTGATQGHAVESVCQSVCSTPLQSANQTPLQSANQTPLRSANRALLKSVLRDVSLDAQAPRGDVAAAAAAAAVGGNALAASPQHSPPPPQRALPASQRGAPTPTTARALEAELARREAEVPEALLCKICLTNEANALINPCSHCIACVYCLQASSLTIPHFPHMHICQAPFFLCIADISFFWQHCSTCPVCRKPIESVQRIFRS